MEGSDGFSGAVLSFATSLGDLSASFTDVFSGSAPDDCVPIFGATAGAWVSASIGVWFGCFKRGRLCRIGTPFSKPSRQRNNDSY